MPWEYEVASRIHYRDRIVIKHGWDIFRWELVRRVADEQACLADRTVADDDTSVSALSALERSF